jgi:hypothetical protein
MSRFIVLFDASPINAPTSWMRQAAAQADLHLVLQTDIARVMSQDPETREALLKVNSPGPDPRMGRYYQRALDTLAEGHTRLALHSVTWTAYGIQPAALIYAFDQMQNERARALQMGMQDADYDVFVQRAQDTVSAFFKGVPADRLLEVSGTEAQKAARAVAFIRGRK